jgi:hypothetical protein
VPLRIGNAATEVVVAHGKKTIPRYSLQQSLLCICAVFVYVVTCYLADVFCCAGGGIQFCVFPKVTYSGRKITESLGNVAVRGGKRWKEQGGRVIANSLSMNSIIENIYYSQLSSVALLLQPERNCFTSYNIMKTLGSLSLCAIVLRSSPPSHVSTCNG